MNISRVRRLSTKPTIKFPRIVNPGVIQGVVKMRTVYGRVGAIRNVFVTWVTIPI